MAIPTLYLEVSNSKITFFYNINLLNKPGEYCVNKCNLAFDRKLEYPNK